MVIDVVLRKRQTSSTVKLSASDSATVAGCSVSQNASIASVSFFSSSKRASGVNSGCGMVPSGGRSSRYFTSPKRKRGLLSRPRLRFGLVNQQIVDQACAAELDGESQQNGTARIELDQIL